VSVVNFAKTHVLVSGIPHLQKLITSRQRQTDETMYMISRPVYNFNTGVPAGKN